MKKNKPLESYIDTELESYMNDDNDSFKGLFMAALIYELGRIADSLEEIEVHV